MQAFPQRRRPPMMQRPRGYGQPAPAIARPAPPPARIAPPPPPTMIHTVIMPASNPTYHSVHVPTVQPAAAHYVTVQTIAGPVAVPVTMAPGAMPGVATQLPLAAPARPVAMHPRGVRQPGMGRPDPFANIGRGPVPPGYRRVIARRRR